jgi:hypothetical protein
MALSETDNVPPQDGVDNMAAEATPSGWLLRSAIALIMLFVCQSMAVRVMSLPLNRLIESRYCMLYYREHDPSIIPPDGRIPEELCKNDWIQQRLAVLQGFLETLHVLCGGLSQDA